MARAPRAAAARQYSAVVKVKTTTAPSGQVTLTESGQCMGSQAETKTVT